MRTIYLRVDKNGITRKIALDMAYLAKHEVIRLPKYYFEEGLYLPYKELNSNTSVNRWEFTIDKSFKSDKDFLYFKFPIKFNQVFDVAT